MQYKECKKVKKKKVGILASAIAVCAICASLIVGSTFALFTSNDTVNITVTSGKVAVTTTIENATYTHPYSVSETEIVEEGTAKAIDVAADGKSIAVEGMIPGDKIGFDLVLKNVGTVDAAYQYSLTGTEGLRLISALEVTVADKEGTVYAGSNVKSYKSAKGTLAAGKDATYHVTLALPVSVGNAYAGITSKIEAGAFAVQGNAAFQAEETVDLFPAGMTVYEVTAAEELAAVIAQDNVCAVLQNDITSTEGFVASNNIAIDMNNYVLKYEVSGKDNATVIQSVKGGDVTVINGALDIQASGVTDTTYVTYVEAGSSLTFDNVELTTNRTAIYARGDAAKLEVKNSKIVATGNGYGVGTNAATSDNYNVNIVLKDSTISGNTAVLVNVPSEVTIDNCDIVGGAQAVIVRAGNVDITDSRLTFNGKLSLLKDANTLNWKDGNYVYSGALTIGNKSGSSLAYKKAVVSVKNSVLTAEGSSEDGYYDCAVSVWANANGVEFTYENLTIQHDDKSVIAPIYLRSDDENDLMVNGTVVNAVEGKEIADLKDLAD